MQTYERSDDKPRPPGATRPAEEAGELAPNGPAPGGDNRARINGVVDVVRPDRVAGWAVDRASAAAAVSVDILREGRLVASVRADRQRPDLARNGIGTGHYGFTADLDPPLAPGMGFTISAIGRADDGGSGSLRRIAGAAPSEEPDRRLLEEIYLILLRGRAPAAERPPAGNPVDLAEIASRIGEVAARIEVAQARLDARLEAPPSATGGRMGLRLIAATAVAAAILSIAAGLASFAGWS